jgi:hypothetical protein
MNPVLASGPQDGTMTPRLVANASNLASSKKAS